MGTACDWRSGLAAFALACGLCGCGGASPATPARAPEAPPAWEPAGLPVVARFAITIDPVALTASAVPLPGRAAQRESAQGLIYNLDIANFRTPESLRITGVGLTSEGDVAVAFTHAHPFAAPNFALPPTGKNRADLGYTGRLLLLAQSSSESYFEDSVQLDPSLVVAPDGYIQAGNYLASPGVPNDTFPYVLLADEGQNNRIGRSNGGSPTGNFGPLGWQRPELTAGATGFDYLHGGQVVRNGFLLNREALGEGPFTLDAALLIKYVDPRGGTTLDHRFPFNPADVLEFAYRCPYSALDISQVHLESPLEVTSLLDSSADVALRVRDWDVEAPAAASLDVSAEHAVETVQPWARGLPVIELEAPALTDEVLVLEVEAGHTGFPNDPLRYTTTLINTLATAAPGEVLALARVTDPEHADPLRDTYEFAVDPETLLPIAELLPATITYQVLPITVREEITIDRLGPTAGCLNAELTLSAETSSPPAEYLWTFGPWASPETSNEAAPAIALLSVGTHAARLEIVGAQEGTAALDFAITVTETPVQMAVGESAGQTRGVFPSYTLYGDRPVVLAAEPSPPSTNPWVDNIYRLSIANTPTPVSSADWTTTTPLTLPQGNSGFLEGYTNLGVANGRLVFSLVDLRISDLQVMTSMVRWPEIPGEDDWLGPTAVSFTEAGFVGLYHRMTVYQDRFAISYHDRATQDLRLAWSNGDTPLGPGDWRTQLVDDGIEGLGGNNVGFWSDVTTFDDGTNGPRLALAYRDSTRADLKVARATVASPVGMSDYARMAVDTTNSVGQWPSITTTVVGGAPRLAVASCEATNPALRLALALTILPSVTADWRTFEVAGGFAEIPEGTAILQTGDRLALFYHDAFAVGQGRFGLARAVIEDPTSETDFVLTTLDAEADLAGYWPRAGLIADGSPFALHRFGGTLLDFGRHPRGMVWYCGID